MNDAIQWRASLGQQVAAAYTQDPQVVGVALGGSVARGWADRHSDIELLVFWNEPPSDTDRLNAITRAGSQIDLWWQTPPDPQEYRRIIEATAGRVGQLWPYEDDEWSEHFFVRGVEVGVSAFLRSTVDRYLVDVVDQCDITERKHILLAAIVNGVPLSGAAPFAHWQARAGTYPAALARAVIVEQLDDDDDDWWGCEKIAERGQRHLLYPLLSQMTNRVGRMVLALNRRYLPDPSLKWLDRLVAPLSISPEKLADRLQALYLLEPIAAVREMQYLFDETLDLVDKYLPDVDTTFARRWYHHRRVQWGHPPDGVAASATSNLSMDEA